jgi:opacity protein-like surface antigen
MGGQDGFSRTVLDYSSEMNSLMAGLQYQVKDKMELGIDFGLTQSEAALAPFELPADDYVETHPTMSFDFTNTYTNSDLDSTRIDADLWAKFWFKDNIWLRLRYHYVDYQDDAPYLYDTSGKYQFASAAVGWVF